MLFIPIGLMVHGKADYTMEESCAVKHNAGSLIIQGPAVNQHRENRHLQSGGDACNHEPRLHRCNFVFPKTQLQYA
jgi:hypothetical protein